MHASTALAISRREANRRSRREAILDIARGSFLENGYDATTMSAIAAALGGSKGTLWNYFPSKELLFAAMIDETTEIFQAQLPEILNPRDGVETALTRFCQEFLQKVVSPEGMALQRTVIAAAVRFPEVGRIFHERALARTRRTLATFLSGAMTRGQLRPCDAMVAARQLTQLCVSGCHQLLLMRMVEDVTPDEIRRDVEHAMDTFMRAFAVEGRHG